MDVPTATDMAKQINSLAGQLQKQDLITAASCSSLKAIANQLQQANRNKKWSYTANKKATIEFLPTKQEASIDFIPKLSAYIAVTDANTNTPFESLTITLEIIDTNKSPISRWHIDQANVGQTGPLFHLQGGGHWAGRTDRENELPIKIPRWLHPPMDLILAVEMVMANFFPEIWNKSFRRKPAWIALVKESQKLCFSAYIDKLKASEHTSYLEAMWADNWQP